MKKQVIGYLVVGCLLSGVPQISIAASGAAGHLYEQAVKAYASGHSDQALDLFQKAVRVDHRYADAFYNMGTIYYQQNNYEQAANSFLRVLELNPKDSQAKYNLALAQEQLQKYAQAVRVLSEIPASDPHYMRVQKKLTDLKGKLKDQEFIVPATTVEKTAVIQKPKPKAKPLPPKPTEPIDTKGSIENYAEGFAGPTGMALGPNNQLYVANYSKNRIDRVSSNGEPLAFFDEEGLKGPIGMVYNAQRDEFYVANYLDNNVVKITSTGKLSVLSSDLNKPYNLILDSKNHLLYVSEQGTNRVSKIHLTP